MTDLDPLDPSQEAAPVEPSTFVHLPRGRPLTKAVAEPVEPSTFVHLPRGRPLTKAVTSAGEEPKVIEHRIVLVPADTRRGARRKKNATKKAAQRAAWRALGPSVKALSMAITVLLVVGLGFWIYKANQKDYTYTVTTDSATGDVLYTVTVDSWSSGMSQNIDKAESIALDIATAASVTDVQLRFVCKGSGTSLGTADFVAHGFDGYRPDGSGPDYSTGLSC